jgi:hypothetical protein
MWLRNLGVAVTLLCFTGCTTMKEMREFSPSRISQEVRPGDHVLIAANNGQDYDLTVESVGADALQGHTASGKRYKIVFESIDAISVERTDAKQGWTAFGVVMTAAVVAFIWALLRALKFESGPGGGESGGGGGGD